MIIFKISQSYVTNSELLWFLHVQLFVNFSSINFISTWYFYSSSKGPCIFRCTTVFSVYNCNNTHDRPGVHQRCQYLTQWFWHMIDNNLCWLFRFRFLFALFFIVHDLFHHESIVTEIVSSFPETSYFFSNCIWIIVDMVSLYSRFHRSCTGIFGHKIAQKLPQIEKNQNSKTVVCLYSKTIVSCEFSTKLVRTSIP